MDLLSNSTHERFMKQAIQLAENAGKLEEIPVGAIVVKDNNIIGRGYNIVLMKLARRSRDKK